MPRADRLSLSSEGFSMPSVDHLSNRGALNVIMDRGWTGQVPGLPPTGRTVMALFVNFARLVDKGLREYDAARAELLTFLDRPKYGLRTGPYLRAVDHLENTVDAAHRGVGLSDALRVAGIGRSARRPTPRMVERLKDVRDAVAHGDEKIVLAAPVRKGRTVFHPDEPFAIRPANTRMTIGSHELTYRELSTVLQRLHASIEAIRQTATGTPGPYFPNAVTRTEVPESDYRSNIIVSDYLHEISRLVVTHA